MGSSARTHRVVAIAIAAAIALGGSYLRLEHLNRDSVWHDEAYSAQTARLAPAAIVRTAATQDNNPPLYYLLLHYWTRLEGGDREDALRRLSALAGVLGLGAVYLVGRLLGGPVVAIWSTALLAASVFHVQYSREARMYSLLFLTATLSMYTFLRLESGRRWRAAAWIVSTILMLMSHTVAIFVWAAEHLCWLFLSRHGGAGRRVDAGTSGGGRGAARLRMPTLTWWAAVNAVVIAAALPWAIVTFHQHQRLDGVFWIQPPYAREPVDVLMQLVGAPTAFEGPALAAMVGALALSRPFGKTGRSASGRVDSYGVLLIWAAVPLLAPWIWSYVDVPILIPRVAIATLAPMMIALAFALAAVRPRWLSAVVGAALVAAFAAQSWSYAHRLTKEDWRGVAALIQAEAAPGDLLLLHEGTRRVGLEYYLRQPVAEIAGFPDHRFRAGETVLPSELDVLRARVAPARRVWLVEAHSHDPHRLIAATLAERFTPQRHESFRQIDVTLFAR